MSAWAKLFSKITLPSKHNQRGPIGFEIRSHSLNIVQVFLDGNSSKPKVLAAVSLPLTCSYEELLASPALFKKMIADALKAHPFVGKRCVSTLPAHKVRLKHIAYEQKPNQDHMQAILPSLRELLGKKLESSVIDTIPIRSEYANTLSRSAIVAIADRADVDNYLGLLAGCGLEVDALEVGPIAIRRLITAMNPDEEQSKILTMNVGQEKTFLTIIWGRRILLDREVLFGLTTLVNAVATELNVSEEDASDLLDKHGFELSKDLAADQQAMVGVLRDIVLPLVTKLSDKIRDVLLYMASETRGEGVDSIFLLGSIAHLRGPDTLLQQMLSVPVQVINPLYGFEMEGEQGSVDINQDEISGIAVATGMALRGLVSNV